MSSISATSNSNYLTPQQQLQAELQQEINSGAIGSSDQGALSSALNDISSSLQSDSTGGSAAAGNASPGDIQSKINGLIANEVSNGNLTQQQATELQGVFQNAFAGGNPDATGGSGVPAVGAAGGPGSAGGPGAGGSGGVHHGHGGHGGHGGASSASSSTSTSSSASASSSDSTSSADQILQQFLQSLQSSASSTSTYNASGGSTPVTDSSSSAASLLINYRT